jgi:Peptidase A4 family/CARDB
MHHKRRLLQVFVVLGGLCAFLLPGNVAFAAAAVTAVPAPPSCAPVGSTATISGSGYGPGAVLVYIDQTQATTNPSTVKVQPDGTWTASFTVPSMAQGTYPLYGVGSPDRASTPFCIGPPGAGSSVDLVVTKIASLTSPVCAGSNPTFRAYILNAGTAASGSFNIRWVADGQVFDGGHTSIAPGVTDTHDHIWSQGSVPPISQGTHTLNFAADFGNAIAETNESNNQITYTFTAVSCPNTPTGTSGTWAGYASVGEAGVAGTVTYTSVKSSFVVPKVTCPSVRLDTVTTPQPRASMWAGLGGIHSPKPIEQAGVNGDCLGPLGPFYYAWFETYPALPVPVQLFDLRKTVSAGDTIEVKVTLSDAKQNGDRAVSYSLRDVRNGSERWSFSRTETVNKPGVASAECIVERPTNIWTGETGRLAEFHGLSFSSCEANGTALPAAPGAEVRFNMVNGAGDIIAEPGDLRDHGSFTVDWKRGE